MMAAKRLLLASSLALAALDASACTSRDETAATAAQIASDALDQGDLTNARYQIGRALAARDDVSDYWLLSGRIALAAGSYPAAFDAYETALTLDRGNVEALTRLCQIAAGGGQAGRAERYADQLLALRPGDKAALSVQAAAALGRGDKAKATQLIGQVLSADPADPIAQIIRSKLLAADGNYGEAARAAEASLATPGDPTGRLQVLEDIYRKSGDAAGYRRTIARLARAAPQSAPALLDQARSLYDTGDAAAAFAVTRRVLAVRPGDVATADDVLHLWRAQGARAMPTTAIVPAAADAPPETRAALAAHASALGRPDLALQVLGDAGAAGPAGTAVNNARVARAQAQALLGQRGPALRALEDVLATDPDQPRALAARGTLRNATGDWRGAVEDLRHALAAAPRDADTRLALAELQLAHDDGVLAVQTLEDGLGDAGADPRLVIRLARLLRAQGRAPEAAAVIADYARLNPFAPRLTG